MRTWEQRVTLPVPGNPHLVVTREEHQGQHQRTAPGKHMAVNSIIFLNGKIKYSWSQLELDPVLALVIEYGKWFGAAVYVAEETKYMIPAYFFKMEFSQS